MRIPWLALGLSMGLGLFSFGPNLDLTRWCQVEGLETNHRHELVDPVSGSGGT